MAKIKKVYQKRFTTVDNTVLNDKSVTWKAKGLFTYLWSKPDNWNYSVKEVSKHAKDGRDSTSDGVQELEKHGYLKRQQINKKGSFGSNVWTLSEIPIFKKKSKNDKPTTPIPDNPLTEKPLTGNPSTDLPMTEKSSTENPALLNTELPNTDNTNKRLTKDGMTKDNKGSAQPPHLSAQRKEVIDYLNKKTGKRFKPNADGNKRVIDPRLKDGYTVDDLKHIIDVKYAQWHGKTFNNGQIGDNYLRPETLFRVSKIEGYLNEEIPKRKSKEPTPDWFNQEEPKPTKNPDPRIQHGYVMPDDSMDPIPK